MDITVKELNGKLVTSQVFSVTVHPWTSIKDIKDVLQAEHGLPARRQRIFFAGVERNNARLCHEFGISSNSVLYVLLSNPPQTVQRGMIETHGVVPLDKWGQDMLNAVQQGFDWDLAPQLAEEGTGGTYFLRDRNKRIVAVFKPRDEEPLAPNNPRGFPGRMGQPGLRECVRSGEGWLREVGAFLLDRTGFHGVPPTLRVEVSHPSFRSATQGFGPTLGGFESETGGNQAKVGSLQSFVDYDELVSNIGTAHVPVREVHKIGILDIRILNCDRNDLNILVRQQQRGGPMSLVPIDHAYSMGDRLKIDAPDWVWMGWRQSKEPFDDETKEFIRNIDIAADMALLRDTLSLRPANLRLLAVATTVLKRGAAAGLTLFEIARIIARPSRNHPSRLERLLDQTNLLTAAMERKLMTDARALTAMDRRSAKKLGDRRRLWKGASGCVKAKKSSSSTPSSPRGRCSTIATSSAASSSTAAATPPWKRKRKKRLKGAPGSPPSRDSPAKNDSRARGAQTASRAVDSQAEVPTSQVHTLTPGHAVAVAAAADVVVAAEAASRRCDAASSTTDLGTISSQARITEPLAAEQPISTSRGTEEGASITSTLLSTSPPAASVSPSLSCSPPSVTFVRRSEEPDSPLSEGSIDQPIRRRSNRPIVPPLATAAVTTAPVPNESPASASTRSLPMDDDATTASTTAVVNVTSTAAGDGDNDCQPLRVHVPGAPPLSALTLSAFTAADTGGGMATTPVVTPTSTRTLTPPPRSDSPALSTTSTSTTTTALADRHTGGGGGPLQPPLATPASPTMSSPRARRRLLLSSCEGSGGGCGGMGAEGSGSGARPPLSPRARPRPLCMPCTSSANRPPSIPAAGSGSNGGSVRPPSPRSPRWLERRSFFVPRAHSSPMVRSTSLYDLRDDAPTSGSGGYSDSGGGVDGGAAVGGDSSRATASDAGCLMASPAGGSSHASDAQGAATPVASGSRGSEAHAAFPALLAAPRGRGYGGTQPRTPTSVRAARRSVAAALRKAPVAASDTVAASRPGNGMSTSDLWFSYFEKLLGQLLFASCREKKSLGTQTRSAPNSPCRRPGSPVRFPNTADGHMM